jgi:hypothetical protein
MSIGRGTDGNSINRIVVEDVTVIGRIAHTVFFSQSRRRPLMYIRYHPYFGTRHLPGQNLPMNLSNPSRPN